MRSLPRVNEGSGAARGLRVGTRERIDAVRQGSHITNERMRGIRASENL
jgi:hypothetical protein